MALSQAQTLPLAHDNRFYRHTYHYFIVLLILLIFLMLGVVGVVLYQVFHRPLPIFVAVQADGKKMQLTSFDSPNLLAPTIIRFASKAATRAYTFDFVNYEKQIALARPYFTDKGWTDFNNSISGTIGTIVRNQLFVNGIVSGTPVISNEGPLEGVDYAWRVQIPFLVSYQSANTTQKKHFYVVLTIIRVSTAINPQGIGIDQFVMV